MHETVQLLSQFGFPVVVAIYLLTRLDKRMEDFTKATTELTKTVTAMHDLIKLQHHKT